MASSLRAQERSLTPGRQLFVSWASAELNPATDRWNLDPLAENVDEEVGGFSNPSRGDRINNAFGKHRSQGLADLAGSEVACTNFAHGDLIG